MKPNGSKIRKVFNIAIVCVFSLLLSCVLGSYVLGKTDIKLPEWTNVGVEKSYFDGRGYQSISRPTLNTLSSGDFQKQVEQWASDHIPFRNHMLVINATLQRNGIRIANSLGGFDCYPTYYNSKQIETADMEHVMFASQPVTEEDIARMNAFASNLNELASEYPDVRFTIFSLDDNRWSDVNPSAKYITGSCTDELIEQELWSHLDKNITVLTNTDLSYEQYFEHFLPTEHHWSFKGWSEAYEQLAEVLGWKSMDGNSVYSLEDYPSYGGTARLGLDFDTSQYILEDYDLDFPNLKWETGGEYISEPGERQTYRSGSEPLSTKKDYYLYDDYYGTNYPELKITNPNATTSSNAIVITDSQGKPLLPFIAQNYQTSIKIDPSNHINPTELRTLLKNTDCKDVIFILAPQSIANENVAESGLFS